MAVTTGVVADSYMKVKPFPTKLGAGPWMKDTLPVQTSTETGRESALDKRGADGVSQQMLVSVESTMSQD